MKAIISHDVDHITVWEHLFKDSIIPKFIVRSQIEMFNGKISLAEHLSCIGDFFSNKWHRVDELISYNAAHEVPSSFFFGVSNGVGLSYSLEAVSTWIRYAADKNCEIGVHGIAYDSLELIKAEHDQFRTISGRKEFGIRMHYVRKSPDTFRFMEQAGYLYDSTQHSMVNPYKIGNMWEFPFQIMDGWVIEKGKRWQTHNLEQAKDETKRLIEGAQLKNLDYLGIDFHDRYYSKSFQTWMDWYTWLIPYIKEQRIEFIDFKSAIAELNSK